jgi:hypothetical protein
MLTMLRRKWVSEARKKVRRRQKSDPEGGQGSAWTTEKVKRERERER